jgi:Ni/Fe-hydrogenase subunit HybB-like protein
MTALTLSTSNRKLLFRLWIVFLIVLMGVGLMAGIQVLMNGLGVTNLTNKTPWGLWIIIDISSIALGAGAFTLSAAVYVFGLKHYAAIARAAVFVGILGYSSAMLALLMDIGRPDRFYHPLIYWNVHSVLWEITVAVVFYTSVLVLDSPIVPWRDLRHSDGASGLVLTERPGAVHPLCRGSGSGADGFPHVGREPTSWTADGST